MVTICDANPAMTSPAKLARSPAKLAQSSAESEIRVATPLRGRKRTASAASLAQIDSLPKVQLTAGVQNAFDAFGGTPSTGIEKQTPTRDTEHLRRRLMELRRNFGSSGHVVQPQVDEASDIHVSFEKLEAYKKAIESTLELQADLSGAADDWENFESNGWAFDDNDGFPSQKELESEDQPVLTFTKAEEDVDENNIIPGIENAADANGAVDESTLLHVTVEYRDAVTGTMMGYLLCDDGDEDLQAMRMVCEENVAPNEDEDYSDRESDGQANLSGTGEDDDKGGFPHGDGHESEHQPVWTFTKAEEAVDENETIPGIGNTADSNGADDESTLLHVTVEYRDAVTGTMLGYLLCDDGDEDLQAVRMLCEESVAPNEDEDYSNRESDGDLTVQTSCLDSEGSITEKSSSYSEDEESDMDEHHEETQGIFEWKDQKSGTVLAYAMCDEETEEEAFQLGVASQEGFNHDRKNHDGAPLQINIEWKDTLTGVIMGYSLCDDCREVEAHMRESSTSAEERVSNGGFHDAADDGGEWVV